VQWFIPVIQAIWEAEIRRTAVQSQLGQKVCKTLFQRISWVGVVVCACNPSYIGGIGRKITVSGWPGQKHETLPEK
jgi:hypothetical protein